MNIQEIFAALHLKPKAKVSRKHQARIELALQEADIEAVGLISGLHFNAYFQSEGMARDVIGSDLMRVNIGALICSDAVAELNPPAVVDIGGGCGITCFQAASQNPDTQFTIVDLSAKALEIGNIWAERLGLSNIAFKRANCADPSDALPFRESADLAIMDFVLNTNSAERHRETIMSRMAPFFRMAHETLRSGGHLSLWLGEYTKPALEAVMRSSFRSGLIVIRIVRPSAAHGPVLRFRKFVDTNRDEDSDCAEVLDGLGAHAKVHF